MNLLEIRYIRFFYITMLANPLESRRVKTERDSLISRPWGYWWNYQLHHMVYRQRLDVQLPTASSVTVPAILANNPPVGYLSLLNISSFALFFPCFPFNFPISSWEGRKPWRGLFDVKCVSLYVYVPFRVFILARI